MLGSSNIRTVTCIESLWLFYSSNLHLPAFSLLYTSSVSSLLESQSHLHGCHSIVIVVFIRVLGLVLCSCLRHCGWCTIRRGGVVVHIPVAVSTKGKECIRKPQHLRFPAFFQKIARLQIVHCFVKALALNQKENTENKTEHK